MNTCSEAAVTFVIGLLLFIYFIKNISVYKKSTGAQKTPLAFLAFLMLYILLLPILAGTLLIFALYHRIVGLILKCRFGSKFGGLLEGIDNIYANETLNSIITILINLEYDEDRYSQSFYDTVRQSVRNLFYLNPNKFPKLSNRFQKFMGYRYMLKNEVKIDDCIRKMKTVDGKHGRLNKEDALRLITEHSKAPLPKNGTVFWEVIVGSQPIQWDENHNNRTKTFPLLLRVHHSVGDGQSLLKLLVEAYADNPNGKVLSPDIWKANLPQEGSNEPLSNDNNNSCKQNESAVQKVLSLCEQMRNTFEFLLISLYVFALAPTSLFVQLITAQDIKRDTSLPKQTILAVNVEVSKEYVRKVKGIKQRIPGTAFMEVLLAAFSASLDEVFAKNLSRYPESVKAVVPVAIELPKLNHFTSGKHKSGVYLQNKFSLLHLNLPLHMADDSRDGSPQITRLKLLQKQTSAFKKSIHGLVNYWLMNVAMANLPTPLTKMFQLVSCSAFVSIFPGPPKLTFYGGSVVHSVVFWFTTVAQTGVEVSILTYDERLHIAVNADETIISDEKAVQRVIDGIYKYIDFLDKECS